MEQGQVKTSEQLNDLHPSVDSSSLSQHMRYANVIGVWVQFLAGCLFLYIGIDDIVRVMRNSEDPYEFGWLVPLCCVLFAFFFITSYFMRRAIQNKSLLQSSILAVIVFGLVLVAVLPASFTDPSFRQELFGTNSSWLRQATLAYSNFAISAIMLTALLALNTKKS